MVYISIYTIGFVDRFEVFNVPNNNEFNLS